MLTTFVDTTADIGTKDLGENDVNRSTTAGAMQSKPNPRARANQPVYARSTLERKVPRFNPYKVITLPPLVDLPIQVLNHESVHL